jgi:hypothetical protein
MAGASLSLGGRCLWAVLRGLVYFLASPVVLVGDLIQPDPRLARGWLLGFMGLITTAILLTWGFGYLVAIETLEANALLSGYSSIGADLAGLPYFPRIQAASVENGVDPALIAAIISQESAFKAEAVSAAGARGLMQILPSTWRLLCPHSACAGLHQPPACGSDCIFDPEANIRAGTRYFAGILDQFGDNIVLSFAAYNAGSAAVRHYAGENATPAATGTGAHDAGSIGAAQSAVAMGLENLPPFVETRSYVRRVLAFWIGLTKRGAQDVVTLSVEECRLLRQVATFLPLIVLGLWAVFVAWVLRRVARPTRRRALPSVFSAPPGAS